ncbi:FKBP-type peptidyl-prolyl cis-trans isomerase [Pseudomonas sp. DSV-1]|uniref:FKBP-type peptidyl-prolyl cis-trans isomerase n=1 Tax=Pseudomonas sp. DSV-1 TaxID=3112250 RepID=UPI002DBF21FB|nr:FKBP-type peptidyl-prolyl cis-trans isomerase [Pseudomonas sp. DSV-1]MEC4241772.1 FKBP-type peptidyl-prolyl cis-trans isomerase [Pseudomonas sp. DSV-1]
MPRYFLMTLLCLAPLAHAAPAPSPDAAHDLAYSLGASLGERLRQEVPDLQIKALVEALRTAYQGKPLALSDERIEQILTQHQAQTDNTQIPPESETAAEPERDFLLKEKQQPQARELADGIILTELKPGTGAKPDTQDSVYVSYVGRLPDGTVFDHSTQPQWFRLDSVIAGWRSALVQMPVGAKWRLVIPSSQAYGAEGAGDLIEPDTPLVFEIELFSIRK